MIGAYSSPVGPCCILPVLLEFQEMRRTDTDPNPRESHSMYCYVSSSAESHLTAWSKVDTDRLPRPLFVSIFRIRSLPLSQNRLLVSVVKPSLIGP